MSISKSQRKFFLCTGQCVQADEIRDYPNSHIIGELHYVEDDGLRVTALAVYEFSLPSSIIPPMDVEIRAEIIGDARRIKCTISHCERLKRWEIGRRSFMQLSQRYGKPML